MSGSDQSKQTQTSAPSWAPQTGALTTAFNGAQSAYDKASSAQAPSNFVAQFDPSLISSFQSALGYAGNNTLPALSANAAQISGQGAQGVTSALQGYQNYDPTAANTPDAINAAANKFVDGQNIDGQVNNSMLNARQQVRDVTLPGIDQNAAQTGNTDSTRTGIERGLVERGLAQQATDLGSTLRGQAYQSGLQLAENQANSNSSAMLNKLGALGVLGNNAVNTGVNAGTQSIADQGSLYSLMQNAGQGLTAAQQAQLDNQLQQYQSNVNSPFAASQNLYNIAGAQNWGQTQTGSSSTTPSAWSVIGGLLGAAGSAAKTAGGLGWKPF